MARPRADLLSFTSWLTARGFSAPTVYQYAYWVRKVLRGVEEIGVTSDSITTFLTQEVPSRYHANVRTSWRAMRDFLATKGQDVPDFHPKLPPVRSADVAPTYRAGAPVLHLTDYETFAHAVGALVAIGGLQPREIVKLRWSAVSPFPHLSDYAQIARPDLRSEVALVPSRFIGTLRAWRSLDMVDPADTPLVPAAKFSGQPATIEQVRAMIDEQRCRLAR
jgi:hypothetical protein